MGGDPPKTGKSHFGCVIADYFQNMLLTTEHRATFTKEASCPKLQETFNLLLNASSLCVHLLIIMQKVVITSRASLPSVSQLNIISLRLDLYPDSPL